MSSPQGFSIKVKSAAKYQSPYQKSLYHPQSTLYQFHSHHSNPIAPILSSL